MWHNLISTLALASTDTVIYSFYLFQESHHSSKAMLADYPPAINAFQADLPASGHNGTEFFSNYGLQEYFVGNLLLGCNVAAVNMIWSPYVVNPETCMPSASMISPLPYGTRQELPWPSAILRSEVPAACGSQISEDSAAAASPWLALDADNLQHSLQPVTESNVDCESSSVISSPPRPPETPLTTELVSIERIPPRDYYKNATPGPDGLFHCPWEGQAECKHEPHRQRRAYRRFVENHLKPHQCTICDSRLASRSSLLRHEREVHKVEGYGNKSFLCPYNECVRAQPGKAFARSRNLREHLRNKHLDH
ncbi:hypothetical protein B0J13DRAFT_547248 [Dactylonectria estremocensis]|uniref:C2H2-type domain-containing protein n=1 Tax=Dactylonectria estremocensis TaxID=1079267 RepID=A0A9P9JCC6_9HYPO|nr:hypothetical protein B0J13DRAFT_547248 [Dactylonectria estremocensis]